MRTASIRWAGLAAVVMVAFIALVLALPGAAAVAGGAPEEHPVQELRAVPVGGGVSLWVHVYRGRHDMGPPFGGPGVCDDGGNTDFGTFASAKLDGIDLRLNTAQLNALHGSAASAVQSAFGRWNGVQAGYFGLDTTGPIPNGPARDETNTVGALNLTPPSTLAAAWTWVDDETGRVVETDVFYSTRHAWAVFDAGDGSCVDSASAFDLEAIAVHEFGHSVALNHVSNAFATMASSAAPGEVRKRTLTAGDAAGFQAALAGGAPPPPDSGGSWCEKHDESHPKYADRCT